MNAKNTFATAMLIAAVVVSFIFLRVQWDVQGMAAATTALTQDIARVDSTLKIGDARLQSIDNAIALLKTSSGIEMVDKIAAEQSVQLGRPFRHSGDVNGLLEELHAVRQDLTRQQAEQLNEAATLRRLLEKLRAGH